MIEKYLEYVVAIVFLCNKKLVYLALSITPAIQQIKSKKIQNREEIKIVSFLDQVLQIIIAIVWKLLID